MTESKAGSPTAGIIGATGYAGAELFRLLSSHPGIGSISASSTSFKGKTMDSVYPNLSGTRPMTLKDPEETIAESHVVFSALPHGHAEAFARTCLDAGKLFIDLSADFRFGTEEATYEAWYGKKYSHPLLHGASVYGLPELNREKTKGAKIIGNPGCYPTCSELALFPALAKGMVETDGIVIDAKSGVTGAGREPGQSSHFPECADSISPYKVGEHRHMPEIESILSEMAGKKTGIVFVPHLVPMNRGIVCTIYCRMKVPKPIEEIRSTYESFYKEEPFVRVLPAGATATNRNVRCSNFCDISLHLSRGGETLVIVSAIDNMVKGASGQAIQNMNIALGFDETAGLGAMPTAF